MLNEITREQVLAVRFPSCEKWEFLLTDESEDLCSSIDLVASPFVENCLAGDYLVHEKIVLSIDGVYLQHDDLVAAGVIQADKTTNTVLFNSESSIKIEQLYKNPFQELIARIVLANTNISQKRLFKVLASESRIEEDSRKYDIDNILEDEIDGVIYWRDETSKNRLKKCSMSTLKNPLGVVRGIIQMNSKPVEIF